jgi:hypothetical protein
VKIAAVTPTDAASDPNHPDHARWVKETTLAMEVAHAQRMGGTLRDAEAENNRLLLRMEALARNEKPTIAKPRRSRQERMLERAVEVKAALPQPATLTWLGSSPCGRCGVCRACLREKRILAIGHLATKNRDPWAMKSMWNITLLLLRAKGGIGEFRGATKGRAHSLVVSAAEKLCDESVKRLGAWMR